MNEGVGAAGDGGREVMGAGENRLCRALKIVVRKSVFTLKWKDNGRF